MFRSVYKTLNYILSHPVGRRHRGQVLVRWLRWQFGSMLLPYPVAVPFVGSTSLVQERRMRGVTGNYYVGLHEFYDMAMVLHFLRSSDMFFDVGANAGSYTVLASGVTGARSICFEPVPVTFDRLERNVSFNRLQDRVQCRRCALGSDDGEIQFTADLDSMNQVAASDFQGRTISVPVTRLDSVQQEVNDTTLAMMCKIDVEGFESQVLNGAAGLLSDARLKLMLLEGDNSEISAILKKHGFCQALYDPFKRALVEQSGRAAMHNNLLWVRDLDFVRERVQQATAFELFGERI